MSSRKRLKINKSGPISTQAFKNSLGPVSSAVFLTQVGMPKEKKRKKRKKGDSLFPNLTMVKSATSTLDILIGILDKK